MILRTYDNAWYKPGPLWKRILWYWINAILFYSPLCPSSAIKVAILRRFGAKVGKDCTIKPFVNIKYPWFLTLGNSVWVGEQVWIDCLHTVCIGNNVCISQGALILTGNHNYKKASFDLILQSVTIADGCWIAAKAIVCPGVQCGSHAVLTVGSVATKNLEPHTINTGIPAQKVRAR